MWRKTLKIMWTRIGEPSAREEPFPTAVRRKTASHINTAIHLVSGHVLYALKPLSLHGIGWRLVRCWEMVAEAEGSAMNTVQAHSF